MSSNPIQDFYESEFARRQITTHLIFGPISRLQRVCSEKTIMIVILAFVAWTSYGGKSPSELDRLSFWMTLAMLIMLIFIPAEKIRVLKTREQNNPRPPQGYQIACLLWPAVKITVLFACIITLLVGVPISLQRNQSDWIVLLLLALLWFPSLEFVTRITPHQKWLTLARIVLTVPLSLWGYSTGYWH